MDLRTDEAPETELNMTPMIDIVFQLIIFFLLSLKFKTIDRRIESMLPKDRSVDVSVPQIPQDEQKIKFKVFRRELGNAERAYTLVKLDNAMQFRLPAGWKGRRLEPPARVAEYDAVLANVTQALRDRVAAYGSAADIKGEIVAPPPRGGAVPHGDVVALLNAFIEVGMLDVRFEGQAYPLSRGERAARAGG